MKKESNSSITPEGIQVSENQIWASMDKREASSSRGPRRCKVVGIDTTGKHAIAFMQNLSLPLAKATRVQISRMVKGSTGWTLEV